MATSIVDGTNTLAEASTWKLGVALWIAGMVGVVPTILFLLPAQLLPHIHRPLRLPLGVVLLVGFVQTAVFLGLFVWAGVALAPKVGLRAPGFAALVSGRSIAQALRPQLLPGVLGGVVVALIPWYFTSHGLIVELHSQGSVITAVLYGGITEEIMLRWGLMTLLFWSGWRWLQKSHGQVSKGIALAAIVISAAIFGAGHLPGTHLLLGHLTGFAVISVFVGGALFGIVTGWLYWRYGLETAILCHAVSHVGAYIAYRMR